MRQPTNCSAAEAGAPVAGRLGRLQERPVRCLSPVDQAGPRPIRVRSLWCTFGVLLLMASAACSQDDARAPVDETSDGSANGQADGSTGPSDAGEITEADADGTGAADSDSIDGSGSDVSEGSSESDDASAVDSEPEPDVFQTDTPIADRCRAYWTRVCEILVADEPCEAEWAQVWNQYLPSSIPEYTVEACLEYTYLTQCLGNERSEQRGFAYLEPTHTQSCIEALPSVDCEAMQTFTGCFNPVATGLQNTGAPCLVIHDCGAEGETCVNSFPLSDANSGGVTGICGPPIPAGEFCRGRYDCGYGVFCLDNVCVPIEDLP